MLAVTEAALCERKLTVLLLTEPSLSTNMFANVFRELHFPSSISFAEQKTQLPGKYRENRERFRELL